MSLPITKDQLSSILSKNKDADSWYDPLSKILPKYDINTTLRVSAFIAQCAHESGQFMIVQENLNYSADGLNKIFSKYFVKAGRDANAYARQPEKIANIVYANRMGNGDTASGDGWKHRGRGLIQLTGKDNYTLFAKSINMTIDQAIAYLETKEGAIESACWFWTKNNLNVLADTQDMKSLTKRINGGFNGLEDRMAYYKKALSVIDGTIAESSSSVVLRVGSKGNDVAKLQQALGLVADGDFGPATKEAVMRFQLNNGLAADGVAGPSTLSKIFK
jgi:putative chitinase